MTTLSYEGVEYNVVYIDPMASTSGDGTTYQTALNSFPVSFTDRTLYLIRRTPVEYKIDMPFSGNMGLLYTIILGMPTEDSVFYNLLDDADVKTAWEDENVKYANIRMNASSYAETSTTSNVVFFESSIKSFISENCFYFRDNDGGTAENYVNPMFLFNTETTSNIKFESCKFSYSDYQLENDDYLANNTDINTNTSKYPQYKCGSYIMINYANEFVLKNTIINNISCSGYHYYWSTTQGNSCRARAITVYNYCKKFVMDGCVINKYYKYDNSENVLEHCICTGYADRTNTPRIFNEIKIINTKINTINLRYSPNVISLTRAGELTLKDIQIRAKGFKNFTGDNSAINDNYIICTACDSSSSLCYYKYKIENISVDFKNTQCPVSTCRVLRLCGLNQMTLGNPNSYIRNIDMKFNDANGSYINREIFRISGYYGGVYNSSGETGGYNSDYGFCPYKININENITISAPYNTGYSLVLNCTGLKTKKITGRIYCYSSVLDIDEIYNNIGSSTGIDVYGNSYLRCKKYNVNINNNSFLYSGLPSLGYGYDNASSIYIDESNVVLWNEQLSNSNYPVAYNVSYVCPNYIQTGQFFARNPWILAKSWNVVRTGSSSSASIRFSHNSLADVPPLFVGNEPYKGFEVQPASTGAKKITAYFAFKNFNDAEFPVAGKKIALIARVPETDNEGNTSYHDVYCTSGLLPDNSTWSNESDLRTYKMEIPVDVKEITNPILIKVEYDLYSASGVTYLDPDIKIA